MREAGIRRAWLVGVLGLGLLGLGMLGGCRVEHGTQGGGEQVRVDTAVGSVEVKTKEAVGGVGLPVYPGAEREGAGDKDSGSADVAVEFGGMRLGVKAVSYRTGADVDEVAAFYRQAMRSYGVVVTCRKGVAVGEPTHTAEGLRCGDKGSETAGGKDDLELRVGSPVHRRMVEMEGAGSGSKFTLVLLDLPRGMELK